MFGSSKLLAILKKRSN